jgi:Asp-tRNA(Asn)/Glu-tRNA(Gln) amidotransferase A subunit family amidase
MPRATHFLETLQSLIATVDDEVKRACVRDAPGLRSLRHGIGVTPGELDARAQADLAWRRGERAMNTAAFTAPLNVTGQPAISLPLHWTLERLPVGGQIVGGDGREDLLFRIASPLEVARPGAGRRPPIRA